EGIPDGRAEATAARQATIEAFILLGLSAVSFLVLFGSEKGCVFVRANVRMITQSPVTLGADEGGVNGVQEVKGIKEQPLGPICKNESLGMNRKERKR